MNKKRIFIALLLFSVSANIFQARYIHSLVSHEDPLSVGGRILTPEVTDLMGNRQELSFANSKKPTLLYLFRPECVWCRRNVRAFDMLAAGLSKKYRVVGLSLDGQGLEDFLRYRSVEFPVYVVSHSPRMAAYYSSSTPKTMLISESGLIRTEWPGAYLGETRNSLEAFFGVSLHDAVGSN